MIEYDGAGIWKWMKASGYWFYFSGTEGHHRISGSNSWSAFPIGSMSLTRMPKLKFFFKCGVILTSGKISASQRPWPFVTLKENNRNCSRAAGRVCVVSPRPRHSDSAISAAARRSACLGSGRYQVPLTPQKNTPSVRAVLLRPQPSPWQAQGRAAGAVRQHDDNATVSPALLGGEAGGSQSHACCSQTPTLGVQMELSQGRQSYSLIWEEWGLEKTGLPPTPPRLAYLKVKCQWSWCWQGLAEGQPLPLGDLRRLPPLRLWSPVSHCHEKSY